MITNTALVAFARSKLGCGYVYGSSGELITEAFIQAKARQYGVQYTTAYIIASRKWIGKIAYDCSGLIRAATNSSTNANGYYSLSTAKGKIATMPDVPGTLVFMARTDGTMYHVGVYVGGGKVVEAKGVAYGVVDSVGRNWSHWGKCHLVEYIEGGDDMILEKAAKGQAVYAYQVLCKKLGGAVGTFTDMVNAPATTGCDGDYGDTMVKVTNVFNSHYGLPLTPTGIVTDELYGKLNQALQALESGVPQTQYDAVVAEIAQLRSAIEQVNIKLVAEQKRSNDLAATLNVEISQGTVMLTDLKALGAARAILDKYRV